MTAVEFIVDELNKEMGLISFVTGTEESYKSAIFSIIERAKAMEKEHMEITWNNAIDAQLKDKWNSYDDFHKTTFKSE